MKVNFPLSSCLFVFVYLAFLSNSSNLLLLLLLFVLFINLSPSLSLFFSICLSISHLTTFVYSSLFFSRAALSHFPLSFLSVSAHFLPLILSLSHTSPLSPFLNHTCSLYSSLFSSYSLALSLPPLISLRHFFRALSLSSTLFRFVSVYFFYPSQNFSLSSYFLLLSPPAPSLSLSLSLSPSLSLPLSLSVSVSPYLFSPTV